MYYYYIYHKHNFINNFNIMSKIEKSGKTPSPNKIEKRGKTPSSNNENKGKTSSSNKKK